MYKYLVMHSFFRVIASLLRAKPVTRMLAVLRRTAVRTADRYYFSSETAALNKPIGQPRIELKRAGLLGC
jgi:hypothetical protein